MKVISIHFFEDKHGELLPLYQTEEGWIGFGLKSHHEDESGYHYVSRKEAHDILKAERQRLEWIAQNKSMSREIKFRAWSNKWDKMVYPNDPVLRISIDNGGFVHSIWDDARDEEGVEICQYTGANDRKGKEIYEGDILKATVGFQERQSDGTYTKMRGIAVYGKVYWHPKELCWWVDMGKDGYKLDMNGPPQDEVFGNIYENPELLNR